MSPIAPKLTIGLPVYNGEKYLAQALDSLLSQTFTDFELIICDNASTDGTVDICQEYLQQDRRISYYRHPINIGCAQNFNRVRELAQGKYFKWAAYDDLHAPNFLAACIQILDADPSIILCHTRTNFIDETGKVFGKYQIHITTDVDNIVDRFRALLVMHFCYQCYGVMRTEALKKSPKMGGHGAADAIFLLRLALLGKFYEIPEYLFFARSHPQQSMSMFFPNHLAIAMHPEPQSQKILPDFYAYAIWFDSANKDKILFPHWRILIEYIRSVGMGTMTKSERLDCLLSILDEFKCHDKLLIQDLIYAAKKYWQNLLGQTTSQESDEYICSQKPIHGVTEFGSK
ncbi:glycosyltransferase family 2 protein [Calothrix sp. NIES-3974]|uniref:glycosyltransferase family 2 protein n=1 Tax=Calothrix sp. NIES-3974 TaxID=2005462 RepID=UPI000B5E502F|nr:glycosyltransferase family 2 protein [Calothrix sp. NIES-3974]BAZ06451.1 family 2 glycosyl transferase [Calothrix sp. NIES-3974]